MSKKCKVPFGYIAIDWDPIEHVYKNLVPCLLHYADKTATTHVIYEKIEEHLLSFSCGKTNFGNGYEYNLFPITWKDQEDFEAVMIITDERTYTKTNDLVQIYDRRDHCYYSISTYNLIPIIAKYGVLPGGELPKLTWTFKTKGGYNSIECVDE